MTIEIISMAARFSVLSLFSRMMSGRYISLVERANCTEVGLYGHVSMLDESYAKRHKLKPLNRFERWLLKPVIEVERSRRLELYRKARQAVIEATTGEDPGGLTDEG